MSMEEEFKEVADSVKEGLFEVVSLEEAVDMAYDFLKAWAYERYGSEQVTILGVDVELSKECKRITRGFQRQGKEIEE